MDRKSTECRSDFETRPWSRRLSVRAACENQRITDRIARTSARPGIRAQHVEWADSQVRPPAPLHSVISMAHSDHHRRLLYPIRTRELRSIDRPDFTGLPEQSLLETLRLDAFSSAAANHDHGPSIIPRSKSASAKSKAYWFHRPTFRGFISPIAVKNDRISMKRLKFRSQRG